MPQIWRLLDHSFEDPAMNLAMEESLLKAKSRGYSLNSMRVWQHPPVISIGCAIAAEEEVNLEACKELGIPIIRRMSPGGALYIDKGSIQYSLVFCQEGLPIPEKYEDSFKFLSRGVLEALTSTGVNCEFQGKNDLVVNGKKICGVAQARLGDSIIHHGTISVSTNLDMLEKVLKPCKDKMQNKGFENTRQRVTTLKEELGIDISVNDFKKRLIETVQIIFDLKFDLQTFTDWELETAEELYTEKYSRLKYIFPDYHAEERKD